MTVQQLLDGARESLQGTKVDPDHFFKKLAEFFGYEDPASLTVDDLSSATWEDLEECGLPKGKAKTIANKVFREKEAEKPAEQQKVVVDITSDPEKHAATLKPAQLVDFYDPDNPTNPYGKHLKDATEGRRCLAFGKDGSFNTEISKTLVQEIIDGYPERTEVIIEGLPLPTYKVGDKPDRYADENPAVPGEPLRPNGESDAGCAWNSLPFNVRQLVYLAVESGEADDDEQDIFDKVEGKTFEQVAKRYRQAAVDFHEKEKVNMLPQLKIRLGGSDSGRRPNDPFGRGNKCW